MKREKQWQEISIIERESALFTGVSNNSYTLSSSNKNFILFVSNHHNPFIFYYLLFGEQYLLNTHLRKTWTNIGITLETSGSCLLSANRWMFASGISAAHSRLASPRLIFVFVLFIFTRRGNPLARIEKMNVSRTGIQYEHTGRDWLLPPPPPVAAVSVVLYLQSGDHSCFIYFSISLTVGLQLVRLCR